MCVIDVEGKGGIVSWGNPAASAASWWLSSWTRLALVHVVPAQRKPDYAPHLFLDVAFVPQLGYRNAREGRINRLLRQSYELAGIVLVVFGQGDEKLALDRLCLHWLSLHPVCFPREIS